MSTQQEARLDVYAARDQWSRRMGELTEELIERLVVLALEDFEFQNGPRGVSPETSLREVNESVGYLLERVQREVENQVVSHLIQEGRFR
jgi:hypothetical protein